MKTSIFVHSRGNSDIDVYDSVGDMTAHLEAIDVLNDEFEVFDSSGQRLDLAAESDYGPIRVLEPSSVEPHCDRLRVLLREAAWALGPERIGHSRSELLSMSLDELVSAHVAAHERWKQHSGRSLRMRILVALRRHLGTR